MATLLVPTLQQALQGLGLGVDAAGGAAGSNLGLHNLKIFPKGRGRADVTQGCGVGALTADDPPTPSPQEMQHHRVMPLLHRMLPRLHPLVQRYKRKFHLRNCLPHPQ